MSTIPLVAATGSEFGGFIGLIIGLLVLVLVVMWLIFPALVLSKFNELLKSSARFAPRFAQRMPRGLR
jgi:hypothetical protein